MSDSLQPHGCSPPDSSAHGIFQARIWSGLPCPPPGDLLDPGIEPGSLASPTLAGEFFTTLPLTLAQLFSWIFNQDVGQGYSHMRAWMEMEDHLPRCCYCSVTQSCLTLCNSRDHNMPVFPVLYWFAQFMFLEFAQAHVHWVGKPTISSCHLWLLLSVFSSITVFSNESPLHIRWPKYWSSSFSISLPMNIQGWFPLRLGDLISLLSKGLSSVFSSTTVWKHQFFGSQLSLWSPSHIHTWLLEI